MADVNPAEATDQDSVVSWPDCDAFHKEFIEADIASGHAKPILRLHDPSPDELWSAILKAELNHEALEITGGAGLAALASLLKQHLQGEEGPWHFLRHPTEGVWERSEPWGGVPCFMRWVSGERRMEEGRLGEGVACFRGQEGSGEAVYITDLNREDPETGENLTDKLVDSCLQGESWWGEIGTNCDANLLSPKFFEHDSAPALVPGVNNLTIFHYPRRAAGQGAPLACTGPHLESLNFFAINVLLEGRDEYFQPLQDGYVGQQLLFKALGSQWHRVMMASAPSLYTRAGINYCYSLRDADRDGPIVTILPSGSFHTFLTEPGALKAAWNFLPGRLLPLALDRALQKVAGTCFGEEDLWLLGGGAGEREGEDRERRRDSAVASCCAFFQDLLGESAVRSAALSQMESQERALASSSAPVPEALDGRTRAEEQLAAALERIALARDMAERRLTQARAGPRDRSPSRPPSPEAFRAAVADLSPSFADEEGASGYWAALSQGFRARCEGVLRDVKRALGTLPPFPPPWVEPEEEAAEQGQGEDGGARGTVHPPAIPATPPLPSSTPGTKKIAPRPPKPAPPKRDRDSSVDSDIPLALQKKVKKDAGPSKPPSQKKATPKAPPAREKAPPPPPPPKPKKKKAVKHLPAPAPAPRRAPKPPTDEEIAYQIHLAMNGTGRSRRAAGNGFEAFT